MDIYSYINSRDIREYLRNTEYEFNTLQAAWLIYFCNRFTLEEKQSALSELISTKQDYETLKRWNENVVDIIHSDIITDEMYYILDCSFQELWFDFPTPFEKGDIVWLPPRDYNKEQYDFVTLILDELGEFIEPEKVRDSEPDLWKVASKEINLEEIFLNNWRMI